MTQKEINGNKLIAEFMGIKPRMIKPDLYGWSDTPFFSTTETTPEKVMESIAKYAKYHTSWDWFMPVVREIRLIGEKEKKYSIVFEKAFDELDITNLWNATISFIKWYNKNQ